MVVLRFKKKSLGQRGANTTPLAHLKEEFMNNINNYNNINLQDIQLRSLSQRERISDLSSSNESIMSALTAETLSADTINETSSIITGGAEQTMKERQECRTPDRQWRLFRALLILLRRQFLAGEISIIISIEGSHHETK